MEGRQLWVLGLPCCCSWHTLKPVVRLPLEQKGTPSYFTHVSCFKGLKTAEAWHTSRHRVIWQPHTCWTWTAWHLQIPLFSFQLLTVKIVYVRLFSICILSGGVGQPQPAFSQSSCGLELGSGCILGCCLVWNLLFFSGMLWSLLWPSALWALAFACLYVLKDKLYVKCVPWQKRAKWQNEVKHKNFEIYILFP